MKRTLAIIAAALLLSFAAGAQDAQCTKDGQCCQSGQCCKERFFPGWYLGIQGGVMYSSSNEWRYAGWDKLKHLNMPNASLNLGYDFTPVFGLRGSLSGPFGNYPGPDHESIHRFGYGQLMVDATFDICNMFRQRATRLFNPYLFVGAGAFYRLAVEGKDAFFGPAVRLGGGLDIRLSELVDLTLELQDNGLHNKFNTLTELDKGTDPVTEYHGDDGLYYGGEILKIKKPFRWDDNIAALIGVKFNFGAVKNRKAAKAACEAAAAAEAARLAAEAAAAAEAARLAAEKAEAERLAAEQAEAERLAAEKAAAEAAAAKLEVEENIYFDLDKTFLRESEMPKIEHLIAVLNEFPEAVVSISGYADIETGNHKHNMDLSDKRAARVKKALTDAGIAADRISTAFYGDTVRVAPEPEKNRVSVCVIK